MLVFSFCIAIFTCVASSDSLPGGYYRRRPDSDPVYNQMAHFAIAQHTASHEFFDTVLDLFQVDVQSSAGFNYRLKFTTAESTCRGAETYSPDVCRPKKKVVKEVCTAFVFYVPWVGERSVTSMHCVPPTNHFH